LLGGWDIWAVTSVAEIVKHVGVGVREDLIRRALERLKTCEESGTYWIFDNPPEGYQERWRQLYCERATRALNRALAIVHDGRSTGKLIRELPRLATMDSSRAPLAMDILLFRGAVEAVPAIRAVQTGEGEITAVVRIEARATADCLEML
jgi:hypothetical protein